MSRAGPAKEGQPTVPAPEDVVLSTINGLFDSVREIIPTEGQALVTSREEEILIRIKPSSYTIPSLDIVVAEPGAFDGLASEEPLDVKARIRVSLALGTISDGESPLAKMTLFENLSPPQLHKLNQLRSTLYGRTSVRQPEKDIFEKLYELERKGRLVVI